MANLRTNNLSGEQGQNAIKGSVVFGSDNNPAGLRIEDNSELELGSETNWTIEFWLFLNGDTHGDYDVILGKGSATSNNYEYFIEVMSDNTLELLTTSTGSAWTFQQQISPVLSANSWHHVAVVRNGTGSNTLKSYINGQQYGSFTAENIHTSAYPFGVGYFAGGNNLFADVTVSNLRIVKGTSVYTANFTPPFHELTAIPNTVLLCCQNSDNPFKEETGKTITGKGRYEYLNDDEVVLNGTFDTDTSDWTTQGDTVEIDNQRLKIIRTGTFGAATQQLNTRMTTGTQYKFRGRIEQSGSPGSALIRLSSASNGNGTVFFNGAYGTGDHETIFTYSSGGGFYVSAICGNGNVTGIFDDISVKAINTGTPPKNIPPYGVDAGNTFGGPIQQSSQGYMYFPTGRTEERGRGRGIWGGGWNSPSNTSTKRIDFIQIQSGGIAKDFGDLIAGGNQIRGVSSSTRGVFIGGRRPHPGVVNTMDFVTIATTANAQDFGDLLTGRGAVGEISNQTRGISAAGYIPSNVNTIEFITIASLGNSQDFGDMLNVGSTMAGTQSSTRGILAGNYAPSSPNTSNVIEFLTIATTGNTQDFGDLTDSRHSPSGTSNGVRAVIAAGTHLSPGNNNTMDFVTIASTGNATDFGDLITVSLGQLGATSDSIRGVFGGGSNSPLYHNVIQQVIISTTGNSVDIGDLTLERLQAGCVSDAHGGLE